MIETVNVINRTLTERPSRSHRRRAASSASGSSSTNATFDPPPRTPMDSVFNSHSDKSLLGDDFAVLKMHPTILEYDRPDAQEQTDYMRPTFSSDVPKDELPGWLCEAVQSLPSRHPLRAILPDTSRNILSAPREASPIASLQFKKPAEEEDDIFAFRPPTRTEHMGSNVVYPTPFPHNGVSPLNLAPQIPCVDECQTLQTFDADHARGGSKNPATHSPIPTNHNRLLTPFSLPGPVSRFGHSSTPATTLHDSGIYNVSGMSEDILHDLQSNLFPSNTNPPFSTPGPLALTTNTTSHRFPQEALANHLLYQNHSEKFPQPSRSESGSPNFDLSMSPPGMSSHLVSPALSPDRATPSLKSLKYASDIHSSPISKNSNTVHAKTLVTPNRPPRAQFRIYFDSPMEDPSESDPIEKPDYELDLDYGSLGFKWEKFDRGGQNISRIQKESPEEPTNISKLDLCCSDDLFDTFASPYSRPAVSRASCTSVVSGHSSVSRPNHSGFDETTMQEGMDNPTIHFAISPTSSRNWSLPCSEDILNQAQYPRTPSPTRIVEKFSNMPEVSYNNQSTAIPKTPSPRHASPTDSMNPASSMAVSPRVTMTTPENSKLKPSQGQSFAPVPGVYISPLKDTVDETVDEIQEVGLERISAETMVQKLDVKVCFTIPGV
ncbi:hypothetical protein C8Q75DRAFT_749385 [Abortiporus biennis]|nr:hypothetical protein C8Q75DRAFT_749385 [Abortiporus biennis]